MDLICSEMRITSTMGFFKSKVLVWSWARVHVKQTVRIGRSWWLSGSLTPLIDKNRDHAPEMLLSDWHKVTHWSSRAVTRNPRHPIPGQYGVGYTGMLGDGSSLWPCVSHTLVRRPTGLQEYSTIYVSLCLYIYMSQKNSCCLLKWWR